MATRSSRTIDNQILRDIMKMISASSTGMRNDFGVGVSNLYGPVEYNPREIVKNKIEAGLSKGKTKKQLEDVAGKLSPDLVPLYNEAIKAYAKAGVFDYQKKLAPKKKESGFARAMDILSRSTYTVANIVDEAKKGNWNIGDMWKEAGKGLTGKDKTTFEDIFNNKWLGLAGDIFLDPTTYLSFGTAGAAKGALKGGQAAVKGLTEGQKAVHAASDSLRIGDDLLDVARNAGVDDDALDVLRSTRDTQGTLAEAFESTGYHPEHRAGQIKKLKDIVGHRELVDTGGRINRARLLTEKINQHFGVLNKNTDDLWSSLGTEVDKVKSIFKNNPDMSDAVFGKYKVSRSKVDDLMKRIVEDSYTVRTGTKGDEAYDAAKNRLDRIQAEMNQAKVSDSERKIFEDALEEAHNKMFPQGNIDGGGDLFAGVGKTFRHNKDLTISPNITHDRLQGIHGSMKDERKFVEGILSDFDPTKTKAVRQSADDAWDAIDQLKSTNPEFADEWNALIKEAQEGKKVDLESVSDALGDLYQKTFGVRIAGKHIPLKKISDKKIWDRLDKLENVPFLGAATKGIETYTRNLRSVNAGVAKIRDSAYANSEQLNILGNRIINRTYGKMNRSADKAAHDEFWKSGGKNRDELAHRIIETVTRYHKENPVIIQGKHYTSNISANDAFYEAIEGINKNLPIEMRLSEDELKTFRGSLNSLKTGKKGQPYDDVAKEAHMQEFTKLYKDKNLATGHKSMSSLLSTLNTAATQYMHKNAFVEGLKDLGFKEQVKGTRKLKGSDFEQYGKLEEKLPKAFENVYFREEDIEGIAKGLDFMFNNKSQNKLMNGIMDVQQRWKALVTSYNLPGYYIRNSMGDIAMNTMNGVPPSAYAKATKALVEARALYKDPEFLAKLDNGKSFSDNLRAYAPKYMDEVVIKVGDTTVTTGQIMENYIKSGLGSTQSLEETMLRYGKGKHASSKLGKVHQGILSMSNTRDNYFRMANYIHTIERELKSGKTTADAMSEGADAVRKYNFDFADFTPTERNTYAKVIPFYRYLRRSIPNSLKVAASSPGRFNDFYKMQEAFDTGETDAIIPGYLRSGMYTPVSKFGGDTAYFRFPNPMLDTVKMFQGTSTGRLAPVKNFAKEFLGSTGPLTELPIGALTGKNPQGEQFRGWEQVMGNLGLPGRFAGVIPGVQKSSSLQSIESTLARNKTLTPEKKDSILKLLAMELGLGTSYMPRNTVKQQRSELMKQLDIARGEREARTGKQSKGELYKESYSWNTV